MIHFAVDCVDMFAISINHLHTGLLTVTRLVWLVTDVKYCTLHPDTSAKSLSWSLRSNCLTCSTWLKKGLSSKRRCRCAETLLCCQYFELILRDRVQTTIPYQRKCWNKNTKIQSKIKKIGRGSCSIEVRCKMLCSEKLPLWKLVNQLVLSPGKLQRRKPYDTFPFISQPFHLSCQSFAILILAEYIE